MKNFLTMNAFILMMGAAAILFVGVFVYAVQTEKSNAPPTGMKTPFGNNSGKAIVEGNNASGLETPNLNVSEISQRMVNIVAESLSFTKNSMDADQRLVQKYFTPSGYEQYTEFLQTSGIAQTIVAQDLQSGAYAEQNPMELNKGVANGAYKWFLEVPVTISFTQRGAQTYRDGETTAQNRRILLRIQFTRVADAQDPDAIRIEIWQALAARK